jgi:hypothetical protein
MFEAITSRDDFTKKSGTVVLLLLALLALDRLPELLAKTPRLRPLGGVIKEMHAGDLNAQEFQALAAGYYEGLESHDDARIAGVAETNEVRPAAFLRYELQPNLKHPYPAGMRITNSLGMANPEYGYEKPPHTRRIAVMGDSVSLGPYGQGYDALLEERLNQAYLTPEIQKFEVLNFSVYGYSILQMMDAALDKASKFQPDVYLVAITNLEAMPKAGWRTHVARLIDSHGDLKYDYLRAMAAQAGIQPNDHIPAIRKKLGPFFLPVIRWALEQVRDRAAAQGAQTIVVLVPPPINPEFSVSDFNSLRRAVDKAGVPVIDLRDTFASVNLRDFQVVPGEDVHPNARGHKMIFDNLMVKLAAQPEVWRRLVSGDESARKNETARKETPF